MAETDASAVGAALTGRADPWEAMRRIIITGNPQVDDRRNLDTSQPHKWEARDFEDPDAPSPLEVETPMGVAAGLRDVRRPTADEVMRYILENASTSDEPMTNSVVRKRK